MFARIESFSRWVGILTIRRNGCLPVREMSKLEEAVSLPGQVKYSTAEMGEIDAGPAFGPPRAGASSAAARNR